MRMTQQYTEATPMPKCDFNKVAKQSQITLRDGCSPVNLLHNFRTPFLKNTSGWLLLNLYSIYDFMKAKSDKSHLLLSEVNHLQRLSNYDHESL